MLCKHIKGCLRTKFHEFNDGMWLNGIYLLLFGPKHILYWNDSEESGKTESMQKTYWTSFASELMGFYVNANTEVESGTAIYYVN